MMTGKKTAVFSTIMAVAALCAMAAYMAVVTPGPIGRPRLEHAHLRLQIVAEGVPVSFAGSAFQQSYGAVCADELAAEPFHFHDGKDQFLHIHWKGMTGGLVLKNYGWNGIGGPDALLGYRFDKLPFISRASIHGDVLPDIPKGTPLWVYTAAGAGYTLRSAHDFLYQDFETFLNRKSALASGMNGTLSSFLFARASAHDGHRHNQEEADAAQINNVLGDIVVFAQPNRPSDAQVSERFSRFEPVPKSVCGG